MKRKFDENLIINGETIELSDDMDKLINKKINQSEEDIKSFINNLQISFPFKKGD